jgi:hypothetical protein
MFGDCDVEIVDSFEQAEIVLTKVPLFQETAWRSALTECFGGTSKMVILSQCGEPWYSLAVFSGAPWSAAGEFRVGAVGYGGPYPLHQCATDALSSPGALASLLERTQEALGLKLAGGTTFPLKISWKQDLLGQVSYTSCVSLPAADEEMFEKVISKNVRTAVRKAQKTGVVVQKLGEKDLFSAHELLTATQNRVGASYETPLKFLQSLHGMANPSVDFYGAFVNGVMCAFSGFLYGSSEAFHLFNGWDREFASLCPNQLLLWCGIKESISRQLATFNFGESHYKTLAEAKSRWGGHEVPLIRFKAL